MSQSQLSPLATYQQDFHYYTFDNYYEVDFLLEHDNQIFPIEVKSGATSRHASLTRYNEIYQSSLSVRLSTNNLKLDGNILNIPLYMAEFLGRLLSLIR